MYLFRFLARRRKPLARAVLHAAYHILKKAVHILGIMRYKLHLRDRIVGKQLRQRYILGEL